MGEWWGCQLSPRMCSDLPLSLPLQSTKAVYDRILDLRIATPQIVINYAMFLEEHKYFEESFKVRRAHQEIPDSSVPTRIQCWPLCSFAPATVMECHGLTHSTLLSRGSGGCTSEVKGSFLLRPLFGL